MVLRDCLPSEIAMRILQAGHGSHIITCLVLLTSGIVLGGPDLSVIPGALLHLQTSRVPQREAPGVQECYGQRQGDPASDREHGGCGW